MYIVLVIFATASSLPFPKASLIHSPTTWFLKCFRCLCYPQKTVRLLLESSFWSIAFILFLSCLGTFCGLTLSMDWNLESLACSPKFSHKIVLFYLLVLFSTCNKHSPMLLSDGPDILRTFLHLHLLSHFTLLSSLLLFVLWCQSYFPFGHPKLTYLFQLAAHVLPSLKFTWTVWSTVISPSSELLFYFVVIHKAFFVYRFSLLLVFSWV